MKVAKGIGIVLSIALIVIGIISVILLLMGYRPTRAIGTTLDWNASGSLAEWVAGIATIAVPIAIYLFDKRMKERDAKLLEELSDFKSEYEEKLKTLAILVTSEGNIKTDSGTWD